MKLINLDIITREIDSDYLRCFWYNNVIHDKWIYTTLELRFTMPPNTQ